MSNYKNRVVDEQVDLEVKLKGLCKFLDSGKPEDFDELNWKLLESQYVAMSDYNRVLKQRISLFEDN